MHLSLFFTINTNSMYILYCLAAAAICMITYRWAHVKIDWMVKSIQTPWLRISIGGLLKLLAFLTTASVAIISVLFIILQAAANDSRKS